LPDEKTLKQRLRNGESLQVAGASLEMTKAQLTEMLSKGAYDLVAVDAQHSAFSEPQLAAFCGWAAELEVPVQLRIKNTRQAYLVGNLLDLGPLAIVVPQVDDVATAQEAVNAFYYPQLGKRSWGPHRGWGYQASRERREYAQWWNENGLLILQLESVDAVINARKIAIPGVDMFVFGPNDLLFSLESYPDPPFKTVDECIRHVVKQMEGTPVSVPH
jgi:2-keto-3-deoxy-L-rhamnonate aldolase RhmA